MEYMKVEDGKLYTPILRYKREKSSKKTITAIGAIHIAEEAYYKRLQVEIDSHKEGFFEGIKPAINPDSIPELKKHYVDDIGKLKDIYENFATYIGGVGQKGNLTYPASWSNPDMALDELINAADDKTLDIFTRMKKGSEHMQKLYSVCPEDVQTICRGLMKFTFSFPALQELAHILINGVDNSFNKLILDERNELLYDAMRPVLNDKSVKDIALIYGAKHLAGVDNFLFVNGYTLKDTEWVSAWDFSDVTFGKVVAANFSIMSHAHDLDIKR